MTTQSELATHIKEAFGDKYFPLDDKGNQTGAYFSMHLTAQPATEKTTLFMDAAKIINELATTGVEKADQLDSIGALSATYMTALPELLSELTEELPSKLEALGWQLVSDPFHASWNPRQFCGTNEQGKPMYGAPACMIVLNLKPMEGRVPVSKPKMAYVPRPKPVYEAKAPEQTKPPAMAAYRKAVVGSDAAGGGGGAAPAPFKGKPKQRVE